jgi:hypothetical protein
MEITIRNERPEDVVAVEALDAGGLLGSARARLQRTSG